MQCPSCSSPSLKPVKLDEYLPARECQKCKGLLIDLLSYRAWADNQPSFKAYKYDSLSVEESSKALICPKCSKLMLKFKISGEIQNRLDFCSNCDDVWLDKGEWELLGSLELQSKLTAVFTEPWQTQIREESVKAAQQKRYKELLGTQDYEKLIEIKEWIESHPKKEDLERILIAK